MVNSLRTSAICWYPAKTFWTQIRPDIMSGLIWIQAVWHWYSWKNFSKKLMLKKRSAEKNKKSYQNLLVRIQNSLVQMVLMLVVKIILIGWITLSQGAVARFSYVNIGRRLKIFFAVDCLDIWYVASSCGSLWSNSQVSSQGPDGPLVKLTIMISVICMCWKAECKTVWILINCLIRSLLIWIYTIFKSGYLWVKHGGENSPHYIYKAWIFYK